MATGTAQNKPFTTGQQKHFGRLMQQLTVAETRLANLEQQRAMAKDAHDLALTNANNFVIFCAEEMGIALGEDGWTFDQAQMRFEQVPIPLPPNGDGYSEKEG